MKHKNRKFFGFTDGQNGKDKTVKPSNGTYFRKGIDFIKYCYPFNVRTRREIKEADDIKLLKQDKDETLCE